MVASSISTYLDVTQAAEDSGRLGEVPTDPATLERAAKLLAAIHAGTDLVTELSDQTGIEISEILALLASLSMAGMVELDDRDGGALRVRLTPPTQTALGSA